MVKKRDILIGAIVLIVIALIVATYYKGPVEQADRETITNVEGYSGNVLAGNVSPYIDFNKADYDKALLENKIVVLYFYANWCPICKAEQPETFGAFNELNNTNLIGFRVNYRDSETDSYEVELAKEFGVSYQHTKVIIKNGEIFKKFPDSWNKERYLEELSDL